MIGRRSLIQGMSNLGPCGVNISFLPCIRYGKLHELSIEIQVDWTAGVRNDADTLDDDGDAHPHP